MVYAGLLVTRSFFCVLLVLLLLPSLSCALNSSVELETIFRGFERDLLSADNESVLPGYGYLKVSSKDFTDLGLSFHGYGWGRYDLVDSKFYDSRSEGELIYGYVEYKKKFSTLRARLGRLHVFEGVANETLDGLWVARKINPQISLSAYAGQPVGLDSANGSGGDSLIGGRLAYHGSDKFDLGLSAKLSENDSNTADSMIGADLYWALPKDVSLFGFSKFNADESGFAEHSWELRIPFNEFNFKPYLQYYDYESYFGTGDKAQLPFSNLVQSGESLAIFGLDSFWRKSEELNLGAKLKFYTYDQNDSSKYLAVVVDFIGEERTESGGELGYMLGDAAKNDYLLLRLYTYQDQLPEKYWIAFVAADLVYAFYDKKINNKDTSLFLSLGTGKHFWNDALDLKLSADYSTDPFYSSDLRGMLSATYYFGGGR